MEVHYVFSLLLYVFEIFINKVVKEATSLRQLGNCNRTRVLDDSFKLLIL
jgi:hypothetical protein